VTQYIDADAVTSARGCCQVTTTLPERAAADRLAATLVEERWAACAQVVGPVESTYRWQGQVERATEWYCHLKTTLARAPGLAARLRELHPYDTPEIVAVAIVDGDPDYLRWIAESVDDPASGPGPGRRGGRGRTRTTRRAPGMGP
jgi:periplasmic divalent cation tolerance protein